MNNKMISNLGMIEMVEKKKANWKEEEEGEEEEEVVIIMITCAGGISVLQKCETGCVTFAVSVST